MRNMPTSEELRELLEYDPMTGVLTWKPRTGGAKPRWWNARYASTRAGAIGTDGNIMVKIRDRNYLAHRLIWAMVHGAWPECVVHRNKNLADNRLKNLRDMTRKAVQRLPVMYRTNTSGVRGVSWNKAIGKWAASIKVDDLQVNLGAFATMEQAAKARRAGERRRDQSGL